MSLFKTSLIGLSLLLATYFVLKIGTEEKAALWKHQEFMPGASDEERTKWQG